MNDWGIIGIGRIGLSMARNMSDKGISLSIYDKAFENKLDPIFEEKNLYPELKKVHVFNDILNFIESIERLIPLSDIFLVILKPILPIPIIPHLFILIF